MFLFINIFKLNRLPVCCIQKCIKRVRLSNIMGGSLESLTKKHLVLVYFIVTSSC